MTCINNNTYPDKSLNNPFLSFNLLVFNIYKMPFLNKGAFYDSTLLGQQKMLFTV